MAIIFCGSALIVNVTLMILAAIACINGYQCSRVMEVITALTGLVYVSAMLVYVFVLIKWIRADK